VSESVDSFLGNSVYAFYDATMRRYFSLSRKKGCLSLLTQMEILVSSLNPRESSERRTPHALASGSAGSFRPLRNASPENCVSSCDCCGDDDADDGNGVPGAA
jgi:hypothetical protein